MYSRPGWPAARRPDPDPVPCVCRTSVGDGSSSSSSASDSDDDDDSCADAGAVASPDEDCEHADGPAEGPPATTALGPRRRVCAALDSSSDDGGGPRVALAGRASASPGSQGGVPVRARRRLRAVEESSSDEGGQVGPRGASPAACAASHDCSGGLLLSREAAFEMQPTSADVAAGLADVAAGLHSMCLSEHGAAGVGSPNAIADISSQHVGAETEAGVSILLRQHLEDGRQRENTADGQVEAEARHKTPKKVRIAYNHLIREAQEHEKEGWLARAVASYKEAMALCAEDDKLRKKIGKLETLRAVRRQSKRQSVLVSKVDNGLCLEAQEGWVHDTSRHLYALAETPEYGLAPSLYTRLLPYQRDGVRWLWELHCQGQGGILGDEMGLGKTCQTVVFLSSAMALGHVHRVLIVAPVSVLAVWNREFSKFCPDLAVCEEGSLKRRPVTTLLYHGSSLAERSRNLSSVARTGGVLITSYALASGAKTVGNFSKVRWDYVVCDEAHKLKNANIQTYKGMTSISSAHRLLLTGTPMQNNLHELRALYDYAVPGLLPPAEQFKQLFARPITEAADRDATAAARRLGEERARELRDLIRPYQLSRCKTGL